MVDRERLQFSVRRAHGLVVLLYSSVAAFIAAFRLIAILVEHYHMITYSLQLLHNIVRRERVSALV